MTAKSLKVINNTYRQLIDGMVLVFEILLFF